MNSIRKILVVDNGRRDAVDQLSVELAEIGMSSVTTSLEMAEDVLDVIDRPAAIFLKMPSARHASEYQVFLKLADQLRTRESVSGVPVIVWDRTTADQSGGVSALLRTEFGPQALSAPDL